MTFTDNLKPNIEVGYGAANNSDSFDAGRDAALQAISSVHHFRVSGVIVFASVRYNLSEVLKGVRSVIPSAIVMGTTTAGEICNGHLEESIVVTVLASPFLKINCGLGRDVSKHVLQAVDELISAPKILPYFVDIDYWNDLTLKGKSVFGVLFSPGNTRHNASQSYEILEALKQKSLGRIPIFGGSAADDWRMEENYIFFQEGHYPDSVVLAIFETQLQYGIAMSHGFVPTSSRATVTKADGHTVMELDWKPAADVYASLTGFSRAELEGKHLSLTTGHTMGVADPVCQYSINVPSYSNSSGGISFSQPVIEGTVLTLMEPVHGNMPTAGQDAVRKSIIRGGITKPALSLVSYCALIERIAGYRPDEEIHGMKSLLAGTPLVGFCSFGEQGVADDGTIRHNNSVISVLVLGSDLSSPAKVALENERLLSEMEARVQERTAELSTANGLLRESEDTLKALMDMLPVGVRWSDKHGKVEYANGSFGELFGYTLDEIPSLQVWYCRAYPDPVYREEITAAFNALLSKDLPDGAPNHQIEANVTCKNGSVRRVLINFQLARDRTVTIFTDITERESIQNRLLNVQRLESLGVLAGGLAHDFNNILTSILGNISFARIVLDQPEKTEQLLEQAELASMRAANLVKQLLTFAKGGSPIKKRISLCKLVTESVSLALTGTNSKVDFQMPDFLPDIEGDEAQLCQAFNNITMNAIQSMPGGGTLTVQAKLLTSSDTKKLALPMADYIAICFTDNGCGIPEDDLKRIFDPYFSTKTGSTGIGLTSVHSIVSKHGGRIDVHSKVGYGSTFTVFLASLPVLASEKHGAESKSSEHGTILVMDDEEMIRLVTVGMIKHLGYQPMECRSGEEAVELYRAARASGRTFAAVILDLTIPGGMGGKDAAQQILAIDPTAYLIVSSGYSSDPVIAEYGRYGFKATLIKPYKMEDIGQVLALRAKTNVSQ